MDIFVVNNNLSKLNADVLVTPVFENADFNNAELNEFYSYSKNNQGLTGKFSEMVLLPTFDKMQIKNILFLGLGKKEEFTPNKLRVVASKALQKTLAMKQTNKVAFAISNLLDCACMTAKCVTEGAIIGTYKFDKYKSEKNETEKISELFLISENTNDAQIGVDLAQTIANAVNNARNLINEPAEVITPQKLAQMALEIEGLDVKVYNKDECKDMGMGAFLAVGQGSRHEPQFIHMKYTPANSNGKTIALIGKGITFDSGGLDIKPPASMLDMKGDMAGAAAILSVMKTLSILKPEVEIHGIIAACENMPDAASYKPGDVLVAMNGKTIEVDNTDAEGRLTLADALCFAENLKPDAIIDIATLTGACCVALGKVASGLLGNDKELLDTLKNRAEEVGEYLWEMPMFEEYFEDLKSDIADFKNAGSRYGGTSAAALFLKKFVKNTPWAHLDIAGTSILTKSMREYTKGPTGVGVRTILNYIMNL